MNPAQFFNLRSIHGHRRFLSVLVPLFLAAVAGNGQVVNNGTVVAGPGSTWTQTYLNVSGVLSVQNGSGVSTIQTMIDNNSGGTAVVTAGGSNSALHSSYLFIGYTGRGLLGLTNGAIVTDISAGIGSGKNGTGTVIINGSTWTNSSRLGVGENGGHGDLYITNGGTVSSVYAGIGDSTGSTGNVRVDGNASSWTNSTSLEVTSGNVTVTNGGKISSDGLNVGGSGTTGSLTISNAGVVASSDSIDVSEGNGAQGSIKVDGANSKLIGENGLYVGYSGGTGSLYITNHGAVESVSSGSGIGNGTATVDGDGSTWTVSGTEVINGATVQAHLGIGEDGKGSLAVTNGGKVSAGEIFVGTGTGAGTVMVDGPNSSLSTSSSFFSGEGSNLSLAVGCTGTGELTIRNGGTINVLAGAGTVDLGINTVTIGTQTYSGVGVGTLNIGGKAAGVAAAGGILNTATVTTGTGTGVVQFNTTADSSKLYYFTNSGTASGSAIAITGGTQVVNTAGYNVLNGANTYSGGTSINGGTLEIGYGGSLQSNSIITNNSSFVVESGASVGGGGTYTQTAGSTQIGGNLTQGTLNIQAGSLTTTGIITVTENMTNSGTLAIDGSSAVLNVNGTFNQTTSGSSSLLHGGKFVSSNINVSDGRFGGMGTVIGNVSVTGGTVQVGASPDTLEIHGNYTQTGGSLVFEIDPNGSGGFITSTLLFDPNSLVNFADTKITFNFLNGADASTYFNSGLFNLDTFFKLSTGGAFGSYYDYGNVFIGDTFALNLSGYEISGFNASTGAIDLTGGTSSSVPESSATLGLLLISLGIIAVVWMRRTAQTIR